MLFLKIKMKKFKTYSGPRWASRWEGLTSGQTGWKRCSSYDYGLYQRIWPQFLEHQATNQSKVYEPQRSMKTSYILTMLLYKNKIRVSQIEDVEYWMGGCLRRAKWKNSFHNSRDWLVKSHITDLWTGQKGNWHS
jgi:hypothetical protein